VTQNGDIAKVYKWLIRCEFDFLLEYPRMLLYGVSEMVRAYFLQLCLCWRCL